MIGYNGSGYGMEVCGMGVCGMGVCGMEVYGMEVYDEKEYSKKYSRLAIYGTRWGHKISFNELSSSMNRYTKLWKFRGNRFF